MKFGNPRFGPAAQIPEQRTQVLARMKRTFPTLVKNSTPKTQQLYARYITGSSPGYKCVRNQLIPSDLEAKRPSYVHSHAAAFGSCCHEHWVYPYG